MLKSLHSSSAAIQNCSSNHGNDALQVNVVNFKDYEKPEGCRVKEGSRKMQRKQQYKSRKQSVIGAAAVASP